MRPPILRFAAALLLFLLAGPTSAEDAAPPVHTAPQTSGALTGGTTDHSKLEALAGPFFSGPEVTKACLSCHTEAGEHFMQNIHWTWEHRDDRSGQMLGKKHLVNNFCTNARGNEGMCAQCHAGYGWKDETFDFTNQENIDCVVCHDGTGSYYKTPNSRGNEACSIMFEGKKPIDWTAVAQQVVLPQRQNCGTCHFNGGGGDNVKHGDLSSALAAPTEAVDVHMAADGLNFACTACHVTKNHVWAGSRYEMEAKDEEGTGLPGQRRDVATCESCHGTTPHPQQSVAQIKLNDHVSKIACQTCHIPEFARGGVATMVDWDWRTAGKTKDGVGYNESEYTQGNGHHRYTYKSIKGSFTYGENLVPMYAWFDGHMNYTTIDTQFDATQAPIAINGFTGSRDDADSRIWPFKQMHTWMPYDKEKNTLVYTHLWGEDGDSFWGNFDMQKAVERGMADYNLPYSGELGFVSTVSNWPITHMVAPKSEALACADCHAKQGRLAGIGGVYMPGRDAPSWLDIGGLLIVASTLLGALGHGLIRFFTGNRGAH